MIFAGEKGEKAATRPRKAAKKAVDVRNLELFPEGPEDGEG